MTTLVTGATGTVGRRVMRALSERGLQPRGFVRDLATATGLHGADADLVVGDFGDPKSVSAALEGVEQVFLTCANHPLQVAWETAAIDEAETAGVRRIIKLSALGAEVGAPVAFFDAHGQIEEHLRATSLSWVLLRPAFKMSNLLAAAPGVQQAGALILPGAGAKVAMIDPQDIADVAVEVLAGAGHDGRTYELTGPDAVTFDEVAAHLSTVLGRPIGFVPGPDNAAVAQMVAAGVPEWFAANVVTQFRLLRQGSQAQANDVVHVLTGREPRTAAEFLRDHAAAFTVGD
jgi:uncharacterized protein YbjT (DUF2867 family)